MPPQPSSRRMRYPGILRSLGFWAMRVCPSLKAAEILRPRAPVRLRAAARDIHERDGGLALGVVVRHSDLPRGAIRCRDWLTPSTPLCNQRHGITSGRLLARDYTAYRGVTSSRWKCTQKGNAHHVPSAVLLKPPWIQEILKCHHDGGEGGSRAGVHGHRPAELPVRVIQRT